MSRYRFISDPGHGWLEAPIAEVAALGIRPSSYSYINGAFAYLEEDCDAPLFMSAKFGPFDANPHLWRENLIDVYQDHTPIRGYRRYPAKGEF